MTDFSRTYESKSQAITALRIIKCTCLIISFTKLRFPDAVLVHTKELMEQPYRRPQSSEIKVVSKRGVKDTIYLRILRVEIS